MRNLHGDIHGRWTPWDEFPDWYATYGFAVRRSPYTGPRTLHVDRGTCGPARGVVRYQSGPEPPPPAPTEGGFLSRLLRWRSPTRQVYFTSFIWYDAHGNTHECTREELCRAFRRLVGDWQELFTLACSVWSAWGAPYLESDGEALPANSDEALERENKLYCVIWPDVKRWREFGTRLWWEAEFFAQYLNYFIKVECAGEMPFAFRRYPGRIDCNLKTRFSDAVRMWNKDNQIDDWAFRMAKIVNQYESSWDQLHGVHGMRAVLVKARTDILNAKGYGAKEGAKHLSAVAGVRHVPPARANMSDLYQALLPLHGLEQTARYNHHDPAYTAPKRQAVVAEPLPPPPLPSQSIGAGNGKYERTPPPPYTTTSPERSAGSA